MSPRGCTALLLSLLPLLAACEPVTVNLYPDEKDFLGEDVVDLMTVVFQAGENAFVGDPVAPEDVIGVAGPGNLYQATYDLPPDFRPGLGHGSGRASLRVIEDGTMNQDPLAFSLGATDALDVVVVYELRYAGQAVYGRATEVALTVTLTATRATPLDPFLAGYRVEGRCDLGATYCDIDTTFRAEGRPRDGIVPDFGDGSGTIDDPDVVGALDLDLDFFGDSFRAEGDVGCCAYFAHRFRVSEVF